MDTRKVQPNIKDFFFLHYREIQGKKEKKEIQCLYHILEKDPQ